MYLLLLALIYLAFISLGLPDSLLGAGWPIMQGYFGVPISYMGFVSMIISGGTIVSSLMSARLTKKFGTKIITVASVFMTAAALFGFSVSTEFLHLCIWAIPYGLGAGAIDAALNNYVALHYSSKHMSWLHCFWGVGAIISPYVMSFALAHSTWNNGYRAVGVIQTAIALILLATLWVWNTNKRQSKNEENIRVLSLREVLKIKGVKSFLIGFFAYCAAESTIMLWASSYLVGTKNMPPEMAAAFASLFYIGMSAGRFASGFIANRFGDKNMIRLGTVIAASGLFCVLIPFGGYYVTLTGFLLIGLGCAPIYPSIIHAAPDTFGAENSQSIIGIQMASAYMGSTLMPPLFGALARSISIKLLPIYMALFFAAMIMLLERAFKKPNY